MSEQAAVNHLEKILHQQRAFNVSETISRGFEIWKSDFGAFTGYGLVYLVFALVLGSVPVIGQVASSLLVSPALSLGGAIYAYRVYTKEDREFANFFDGFTHWQTLILVSGVTITLAILFLAPIIFAFGWESFMSAGMNYEIADFEDFELSSLSLVIMSIAVIAAVYIGVCLSYAVYIAGFFELGAVSSLKYSYKFVSRQWVWVFLYTIAAGICAISGLLLLLVGIVITYPMIFAMQFAGLEELTAVKEFYQGPEEDPAIVIEDMFG